MFDKIKSKYGFKEQLWIRDNGNTLLSQALDIGIFDFIVFIGVHEYLGFLGYNEIKSYWIKNNHIDRYF